VNRRDLLRSLVALPMLGCGRGTPADCVAVPDETAGPYADSDGMIASTQYQRADITEGKPGTPLALALRLIDGSRGCTPIVGARVILWHCDANGVYSEYASPANVGNGEVGSSATTFLRGWQPTDGDGTARFTTIYPGWYPPRVTHIHVQIYNPSDLATPVKTTQLAFPDGVSALVYTQATLYAKGQNATSNANDMVFAGNTDHVLVAVSGDNASGYSASLTLALAGY
jgi:protocatechuate 3,4-dioxygenase beta subunit